MQVEQPAITPGKSARKRKVPPTTANKSTKKSTAKSNSTKRKRLGQPNELVVEPIISKPSPKAVLSPDNISVSSVQSMISYSTTSSVNNIRPVRIRTSKTQLKVDPRLRDSTAAHTPFQACISHIKNKTEQNDALRKNIDEISVQSQKSTVSFQRPISAAAFGHPKAAAIHDALPLNSREVVTIAKSGSGSIMEENSDDNMGSSISNMQWNLHFYSLFLLFTLAAAAISR